MKRISPAKNYWSALLVGLAVIIYFAFWLISRYHFHFGEHPGQKIDSLNGVYIYYNGSVGHVAGRNTAPDGYNLGLKYQCVEFVKRYYYQRLHHKMPDAGGHAKDFFDPEISDGAWNPKRGLIQYSNPGKESPQPDDLLVFGPTQRNPYGHVAIVAGVTENEIEVVQQNPGPFGRSRVRFLLRHRQGWEIADNKVLGWLRKPVAGLAK